jgi:hypothetical protein
MQHSINILKEEEKQLQNNLSIIPDNKRELRELTFIKLEDLTTAITCLELVKNNINPFTNSAFKSKNEISKYNEK